MNTLVLSIIFWNTLCIAGDPNFNSNVPHEILGIPKNASVEDARKALTKLALRYNPSLGMIHLTAEEFRIKNDQFKKILAAYSTFLDRGKKGPDPKASGGGTSTAGQARDFPLGRKVTHWLDRFERAYRNYLNGPNEIKMDPSESPISYALKKVMGELSGWNVNPKRLDVFFNSMGLDLNLVRALNLFLNSYLEGYLRTRPTGSELFHIGEIVWSFGRMRDEIGHPDWDALYHTTSDFLEDSLQRAQSPEEFVRLSRMEGFNKRFANGDEGVVEIQRWAADKSKTYAMRFGVPLGDFSVEMIREVFEIDALRASTLAVTVFDLARYPQIAGLGMCDEDRLRIAMAMNRWAMRHRSENLQKISDDLMQELLAKNPALRASYGRKVSGLGARFRLLCWGLLPNLVKPQRAGTTAILNGPKRGLLEGPK